MRWALSHTDRVMIIGWKGSDQDLWDEINNHGLLIKEIKVVSRQPDSAVAYAQEFQKKITSVYPQTSGVEVGGFSKIFSSGILNNFLNK